MDRPTGGSRGKSVRTCVCLTRCLGLLWTPSLPSLPPILKSLPSPVMTHLHHQIHCRQEFAQPPLLGNRKCLPLWDILPLKWEAVIIRANISRIHIVSKAHTLAHFLDKSPHQSLWLVGWEGTCSSERGNNLPTVTQWERGRLGVWTHVWRAELITARHYSHEADWI